MKIAIIGGGITGLSTALALNKEGFECHVYEKSKVFAKVGAGIWIQPNALKVFEWLGIKTEIQDAGHTIHQATVANRGLQPLSQIKNSEITQGTNNHITSIHRHALHQVMLAALPEGTVHMDAPYNDHSIANNVVEVKVGHTTISCDLLLGADGIHSALRQQIFPNSQLRYAGQTCWRGIADFALPPNLSTTGHELWGHKIRFGFAPISTHQVYWFAVALAKENGTDNATTIQQELLNKFGQHFDNPVQKIIENTPQIIRNDIHDLKKLKSWSDGPVFLLGDAAHATTPNMGQGGCQGIEDAYYFAKALRTSNNLQTLGQRFEKVRRKKVDYIVNNSWNFGKMAHQPIGQALLKLTMRFLPDKLVQKEMAKVYAVDGLD